MDHKYYLTNHPHHSLVLICRSDLPDVIELVDVVIQAADEGEQQHHLDKSPVEDRRQSGLRYILYFTLQPPVQRNGSFSSWR